MEKNGRFLPNIFEKLEDFRDMALAVCLWVFVHLLIPALMSGLTAAIVTTLIFFLKNQ